MPADIFFRYIPQGSVRLSRHGPFAKSMVSVWVEWVASAKSMQPRERVYLATGKKVYSAASKDQAHGLFRNEDSGQV